MSQNQKLATLQNNPTKTSWRPLLGYLMLTPSTLPETTEHGIVLPESMVKKNNSGIVVRTPDTESDELWLGKEIVFALNHEYKIKDSDNQVEYYVISTSDIILVRIPPAKPQFHKVTEPIPSAPHIPMIERSL